MKDTFTSRVQTVVSGIPPGHTMSYKAVAQAAGQPNAYRAVGTIMSRNMNPTVPCHRVIHANGRIGAYNRGGPTGKKDLLVSEGVSITQYSSGYYLAKTK